MLEELQEQKIDPEYWSYLRYCLGRMENEWKQTYGKSVSQSSEDGAEARAELWGMAAASAAMSLIQRQLCRFSTKLPRF